MTLNDLLTEARSELDMIESAPATFGNAARAKARERVRVLEDALRLPVLVSCGDCSHFPRDRGAAPDTCSLAHRDLPTEDVIPEWCPLRGGTRD